MNITLLNSTVNTIPTAKGSYQQLEIAFKNNTFQGKVEGKKIMSFGASKPVFDVLSVAQPGTTYEVTTVKNDKGYIDWTAIQVAGAATPVADAIGGFVGSVGSKTQATAARSSYETPEERAQRQVFIVRQSSVSNAVSTLTVGAKALKADDVIALAKKYEDYVFGKNQGGLTGFDDVPTFSEDFDKPSVE